MTNQEWFKQAKDNQQKIEYLIDRYHPVNTLATEYSAKRLKDGLAITAPNAELACEVVRQDIREKQKVNPVEEFRLALKLENLGKAYTILSDTWFGVPESTSCWSIKGFKEAVDLLEEMPEERPFELEKGSES